MQTILEQLFREGLAVTGILRKAASKRRVNEVRERIDAGDDVTIESAVLAGDLLKVRIASHCISFFSAPSNCMYLTLDSLCNAMRFEYTRISVFHSLTLSVCGEENESMNIINYTLCLLHNTGVLEKSARMSSNKQLV